MCVGDDDDVNNDDDDVNDDDDDGDDDDDDDNDCVVLALLGQVATNWAARQQRTEGQAGIRPLINDDNGDISGDDNGGDDYDYDDDGEARQQRKSRD